MSGESAAWAAEEFPLAVCGQLRMTRVRLGWTLAEAGDRLPNKLSASVLCRIETCQRPLRLQNLWAIATTYGQSVAKIVADAAATVGPSCPLPCFACKGTGVSARPPQPRWVPPPQTALHSPGFHSELSQP